MPNLLFAAAARQRELTFAPPLDLVVVVSFEGC